MNKEEIVRLIEGLMGGRSDGAESSYEGNVLFIYRKMGSYQGEWAARYAGNDLVTSANAEEIADGIIAHMATVADSPADATLRLGVLFNALRPACY